MDALTLIIFLLLGVVNLSHQIPWYLSSCTVRYDTIKYYNYTCEEVYLWQPFCKKKLTVAYSDFKPYVYQNENGTVDGVIPIFFRKVLKETCCLGCGMELKYLPEKGHDEKIYDQMNYNKAADIVMPAQNTARGWLFLFMNYTNIADIEQVKWIGVLEPQEPSDKMTSLFRSLMQTWPLLVMTLFMAVAAGSFVWLLDSRSNDEQFPEHFPTGMFEGIWWAFVSMTTVGYGDRTPSFWAARLFAVVWIFFGVTFFGMYLGTITSVMTTNMQAKIEFTIENHKIGVLSWANAARQATISEKGIPQKYETVEELISALKSRDIHAIALDEYMTGYYISDIQEAIPKAAIQMAKKPLQAGIGVGTYDSPIRTLVNSFYGANHDNIYDLWFSIVDELMIKTKRRGFEDGHKTVADINKKDDPVEPLFTYKHQSFTICIGSAFVFSCLCVIVNQIIVNKRKNKTNLPTK